MNEQKIAALVERLGGKVVDPSAKWPCAKGDTVRWEADRRVVGVVESCEWDKHDRAWLINTTVGAYWLDQLEFVAFASDTL